MEVDNNSHEAVTNVGTVSTKVNKIMVMLPNILPDVSSLSWNEIGLYASAICGLLVIILSLIAGATSMIFGLRVNFDQKWELAELSRDKDVQIEKVRTDGETKLGVETEKVRQDAQTKIETARADADAKIAEAKAEADAKIEQARTDAQRDVAAARVELVHLNLSVAEQQERAANAEKALLELQERLAPRRLTDAQKSRLIEVLAKHPDAAFFACKVQNIESCGFAEALASAFREAGWEVLVNKSSLNMNTGFTVFANTENGQLPALDTALLAFREAGLAHHTDRVPPGSISHFPPNVLFIVVGEK